MSVLRKKAFPVKLGKTAAWTFLLLYTLYATSVLNISLERIILGLENAQNFFARMFPPNTARDKLELIHEGILQSLQIAILSTFAGIVLSLPTGLAAARNLAPGWLSWTARAVIAICRTFHPLIVAILFVKAVGFGALAGTLALVVATIGFVGKLFAEIVEEIDAKQVEAVRATGASFMNVLLMAVLPQVMPRFTGLAIYQFDSNLRNSTIVGIVGGGGIGAALFTASQRFDYDVVLTIILIIIAMIMVLELVSSTIRRAIQ